MLSTVSLPQSFRAIHDMNIIAIDLPSVTSKRSYVERRRSKLGCSVWVVTCVMFCPFHHVRSDPLPEQPSLPSLKEYVQDTCSLP